MTQATKDNESILDAYTELQIEKISPAKRVSVEILKRAEKLEVTSPEQVEQAKAIRKEATTHIKEIGELRLGYTRQLDEVKTKFIGAERHALEEAAEAKNNVGRKLIAYETEQEQKREAERQRVRQLVDKLTDGLETYNIEELKTQKEIDAATADLNKRWDGLSEDDARLAELINAKVATSNALQEREIELKKIDQDSREAKLADLGRKKEQYKAEKEMEAAKKQERAEERAAPKTGLRTRMTFEIIEPHKVPRELCEPSDKLIREYINRTGAEVDGVIIKRERSL